MVDSLIIRNYLGLPFETHRNDLFRRFAEQVEPMCLVILWFKC